MDADTVNPTAVTPPAQAGVTDDEQGNRSAARVYLAWALPFAAIMIAVDTVQTVRGGPNLPNSAYTLVGAVLGYLILWAAGPRVAQYVGPQVAGVGAAIANAIRDRIAARAGSSTGAP